MDKFSARNLRDKSLKLSEAEKSGEKHQQGTAEQSHLGSHTSLGAHLGHLCGYSSAHGSRCFEVKNAEEHSQHNRKYLPALHSPELRGYTTSYVSVGFCHEHVTALVPKVFGQYQDSQLKFIMNSPQFLSRSIHIVVH